MTRTTLTKLSAYGGAAVVGVVAAVVSFGHLRSVALSAGEGELAAALLPVSVDGLLISAAAVMVADKQQGRVPRMSARMAFAVGCVATVAGNIASATPTPLGWAVAGWAPLALLLVTEMLVRQGRLSGATEAPLTGASDAAMPDSTPGTSTGNPDGNPSNPSNPSNPKKPGSPVRPPSRKSGRKKKTSAERITAALVRQPAASVTDLVKLTSLSERTIRRHLPAAQNGNGNGAELVSVTEGRG